MRVDLKFRELAFRLGWTATLSQADRDAGRYSNPTQPLRFTKGNKVVWLNRFAWTCSEIVNGQLNGARGYAGLEVALRRE